MLFHYKAVSPEGGMSLGEIDAFNLADLENRLKRMNLDLISGKPAQQRKLFGRRRIPRREMINFCFHLEQFSRSGVPLLEGLTDLENSLHHAGFRKIIAGLIEGIEGGQTLSLAMSAHPQAFSPVLVSLVRAGEAAGKLPDVLASLTESLKWEDELASHTKKLLMYPSVVGLIMLATASFLMLYLVPQLKHFVTTMGQTLPLQSKALFFLSDLLVDYWHVFTLIPIAFALALRFFLRLNPLVRLWIDGLKLRIPLTGDIFRKIILSRFAGTFAMLYAAGIPVLEAVRISQDLVGNGVIRQALEDIEFSIQEGRNLAGAFQDAALFPPLVVRMLGIGESTGNLDQALQNVSYFYSRDVRESVEKVLAMMEPALTLLMGGLLGWIVLSVMGPIYDIVSKVKL